MPAPHEPGAFMPAVAAAPQEPDPVYTSTPRTAGPPCAPTSYPRTPADTETPGVHSFHTARWGHEEDERRQDSLGQGLGEEDGRAELPSNDTGEEELGGALARKETPLVRAAKHFPYWIFPLLSGFCWFGMYMPRPAPRTAR
jgi:hypothetical protein